ncbi:hypothetical protein Ppa06_39440 [Planomonospora parontospora subsp. parontospora]|uniref:Uncharacterized protein n=1 Tax=Planomonospora parontospora subsp. parontospora TaxID=97194 RepID=A0ABQ4HD99_9ACTN|nr:hypothetical protein Ppa06_39440 [Planomonospora parontospora subsp. parontospora]
MFSQVRRHRDLHVRQVGGRHVAQTRVQVDDVVTGQAVEHTGPLAAGGDQAALFEGLQMGRGARDAQACGLGQDLDAPFSLCEQVKEL